MTEVSDYYHWRQALAGKRPPVIEDEPMCGWYKRRFFRGGPWVPCVIWRATDGEIYAELGGEPKDPKEVWVQVASKPILPEEFERLSNPALPQEVDINTAAPVV